MNKGLKILLIASGFFMFAGEMFAPIYAIFVEKIGGDILTAGSTYALYAISAGILIFLISRWEDHIKHKERLVVAGYACRAVGFLGLLFVARPLHLFIVQIIFGIGEAVGVPAYDGLYSKYLDKGKFVSEWGMWESMAYIVGAVGALAGGLLGKYLGFKALFVFMLALSLVGLIVSARLLTEKIKTKR